MQKPIGTLTSAQHEIMAAAWDSGAEGVTVTEIWQAISARRRVGRTTILNLVDRLERRGWLVRRDREKPCHYLAAMGREETAVFLAGGFVDDFFAGSASNLVMSLLGSNRLKPAEIERLRRVLESTSPEKGTVPICAQHPAGHSGKWGQSPFPPQQKGK